MNQSLLQHCAPASVLLQHPAPAALEHGVVELLTQSHQWNWQELAPMEKYVTSERCQ